MSWIPGWNSVAGAEWWSGLYFWLSIACLIGLGITEVASHRYGERKDELAAIEQDAKDKRHEDDLKQLQHDTAQAQERAAKLSKEAAEAQSQLMQMRFPRSLNVSKFEEELNGKPTASVEILYDTSSADAQMLANAIWRGLFSLGWEVQQSGMPRPLGPPEKERPGTAWLNLTWLQQAGAGPWGVSVVTSQQPDMETPTAASALLFALAHSVIGPPVQTSFGNDPSLPDGKVRVVVGPKLP